MAKKHRIHPQGTSYIRNAVPDPHEVAEFVAPRTVGDGFSVANIFGDAAELSPFAGAVPYVERELGLRDYSDDDILMSAILGFPIVNKVGGKLVHNAKQALGPSGWSAFKNRVKAGKRNLYSVPPTARKPISHQDADEVLSSRGRIGATQDIVNQPTVSTVFGPFDKGGTNSGIRSSGQAMRGMNTVKTTGGIGNLDGSRGYTGNEIYSPLRKPNDNITYGPWLTESSKADKPLRDNLNKLEDQWQFYIDTANGPRTSAQRKQDMIMAAEDMGRPDVADRILNGEKSGRNVREYKPYNSFQSQQSRTGSITDWMDLNNRQAEKRIREQFSMIPDDLKAEFAQRYGTYDLLNDWQQNPTKWDIIKAETTAARKNRNKTIRSRDKEYGRNIQR